MNTYKHLLFLFWFYLMFLIILKVLLIQFDYFLNQCASLDERFNWTDTLGMRSLSCNVIETINLEELLAKIYRGYVKND